MLDILSYRQWAISQAFFNRVGLLAWKLLMDGNSLAHLIKKYSDEDIVKRYDQMLSAEDGIVVQVSRQDGLFVATTRKTAQNIALIPVLGALTKRGDLCSYGMRDYISMLDRANRSDKVAAIVLDVESPGGTTDGTGEFGLAVKNSKKPVVTFGDSQVASAAYWVASQSKFIIANKFNPTEFGSIGTLYVHENWQAYIQKEIGSIEIIRAPQSVDKAKVNPFEELGDEQRMEIIQELKDITKEFVSTVKKGRAGKLNIEEENIFTGKMYKSSEAIKLGMIDDIGSFQDAIDKAGELATNNGTKGRKPTANNMSFKSKLLSAIFGKSEKAEEEKPTAEEQQKKMEAADAKAAEIEAENLKLKEEKEAAEQKVKQLEATVTEQKTQITNLETKVAEQKVELDKQPTGQKTTIISKEEKEKEQAGDGKNSATKSFRTKADEEADVYVNALYPNSK